VDYIDGLGGLLGFADCTYSFGNRCVAGVMVFDKNEFQNFTDADNKVTILHEMGHVLGLVNIFNNCNLNCGPNDYEYKCLKAKREFAALRGDDVPLQLENTGGEGTACYHWKQDIFRTDESSEIMTGIFESDKGQPISRVSVAALDDIGVFEGIDYSQADVWPYTSESSDNENGTEASKWQVLKTDTTFSLLRLDRTKVSVNLCKNSETGDISADLSDLC